MPTLPVPANVDEITADTVIGALGKSVTSDGDLLWLETSLARSKSFVTIQQEKNGVDDESAVWACLQLAMRLFGRRNSTTGVIAFDVTTAYISKYDSDIASALRLGRPRIG